MDDLEAEEVAFAQLDIAPWRQNLSNRIVNTLTALGHSFIHHWLGIANTVNILLLLGTFVTPLLVWAGWTVLSTPLYQFYSLFCLQRPDHSFFLANYQMGMEVRMVAISAGNVAAGLWFSQFRKASAVSWQKYFLLTVPMLLDVFSQTFGLRDSNWFFRSLTGFLFGVATIWYFYPRFEKNSIGYLKAFTRL